MEEYEVIYDLEELKKLVTIFEEKIDSYNQRKNACKRHINAIEKRMYAIIKDKTVCRDLDTDIVYSTVKSLSMDSKRSKATVLRDIMKGKIEATYAAIDSGSATGKTGAYVIHPDEAKKYIDLHK